MQDNELRGRTQVTWRGVRVRKALRRMNLATFVVNLMHMYSCLI